MIIAKLYKVPGTQDGEVVTGKKKKIKLLTD
jgi:hypothetical protein